MRLDLDTPLSIPVAFAMLGLTIQLIGSLFGAQLSDALAGTFGGIIIASFTAEGVRQASKRKRRLLQSTIAWCSMSRENHHRSPRNDLENARQALTLMLALLRMTGA